MAEACTIRAAFFPQFAKRQRIEKPLKEITVIVGDGFPEQRLKDFVRFVYPQASVAMVYHDDPRLEPIPEYVQNTYDGRNAGIPNKAVMVPRDKDEIYGTHVIHLNFFDVHGGQIFWWSWTPEENDTVKRKGIR